MTNSIVAEGLTKRFGTVTAVDGIDLAGKEGTVFGLLGPNGAGKTTTVHILATLVTPTRATRPSPATTCKPRPTRSASSSAWPASTPASTRCSPEPRTWSSSPASPASAVTRRSSAPGTSSGSPASRTPAAARSRPTRAACRRLDLAASLVARPRVLFLDEPTTGLDPRSRNDMWNVVRDLTRSRGHAPPPRPPRRPHQPAGLPIRLRREHRRPRTGPSQRREPVVAARDHPPPAPTSLETVTRRERPTGTRSPDQPPVPAAITLTESRLTDDDAHPVDL
jgi:energy-coupling factor transporter ATP-binding protein EcfA2